MPFIGRIVNIGAKGGEIRSENIHLAQFRSLWYNSIKLQCKGLTVMCYRNMSLLTSWKEVVLEIPMVHIGNALLRI